MVFAYFAFTVGLISKSIVPLRPSFVDQSRNTQSIQIPRQKPCSESMLIVTVTVKEISEA